MFGGGMSERTIATTVRRALESEPSALLRPDQERHPVPDAVQDCGHGAREVRRPSQLLVPELCRATASARPPSTWQTASPGRPVSPRQQTWPRRTARARCGSLRRRPGTHRAQATQHAQGCVVGAARRPGNDGVVAVGAARRADDGVRRSHQSARHQRREERSKLATRACSPSSTSSTC